MRIFVEPEALVAGELVVRGDEHHYLCRVRRARVGDPLEVVDGEGRRAPAVIERFADDQTTLRIGPPEAIAPSVPFVRVLLPLIKGDRMDACLEKLVEVGADAIIVWPAERSIAKLDDDKREQRIAKYQSALRAAARQCGRAQVPIASFAEDLAAAIATATGTRIVLDPASDAVLGASGSDTTIVSGPEGGFDDTELAQLAAAGFVAAGLGPRILRAETAPMIAVALIRAATRT